MRVAMHTGWSLCVAAAVVASAGHASFAGERTNLRGLGMARTSVAFATGLDAVSINPANLGMFDSTTMVVDLLPVGLHVGSDFLDYQIYTTYFTGVPTDSGRAPRYLNEDDKQRILNGIAHDLPLSTADVEAGLFGVAFRIADIGGMAFTITERQNGYALIPKDYAQFLLYGNEPGTTLNFSETEMKASWMREYALSLGFKPPAIEFVQSLSVGVAAKLLHGYGFYATERFNSNLVTQNNGVLTGSVDFLAKAAGISPFENGALRSLKLFPSPSGYGYALDFGVAGGFDEAFSFGLAMTDVGSMTWSGDAKEISADTTLYIDDPFVVEQGDAVREVLKGRRKSIESFKSDLPTTFRAGVALAVHKLPGMEGMSDLLIGLDFNKGLCETPGSTRTPRVSLGVEYAPLDWLPLRSGISVGGTDHFNVAFGFGLHLGVFDLDLASENVTWLFAPKSFSHGSAALGMRLRI